MKITTTQTETKTVEIEINFPTFTKVVSSLSTAYYCIKSEDEVLRLEQYNGTKIVTVSNYSNTNEAFGDGFEFIAKGTFFENYNKIVAQMWEDMEQLEASLIEGETAEKEEEQGYEYNPETQTMN
jgi:hypothetical protein